MRVLYFRSWNEPTVESGRLTNFAPLVMRTLLQFDSVLCSTIVRCLETEPNGVIIGLWYSGRLEGSSIVNSRSVVLIATELTVLNRLRSKTTQVHCFSPYYSSTPAVYQNLVQSTSKLQHAQCPGDMEASQVILTRLFVFGWYKVQVSAGIPATVIGGFRSFTRCKQISFRIYVLCPQTQHAVLLRS